MDGGVAAEELEELPVGVVELQQGLLLVRGRRGGCRFGARLRLLMLVSLHEPLGGSGRTRGRTESWALGASIVTSGPRPQPTLSPPSPSLARPPPREPADLQQSGREELELPWSDLPASPIRPPFGFCPRISPSVSTAVSALLSQSLSLVFFLWDLCLSFSPSLSPSLPPASLWVSLGSLALPVSSPCTRLSDPAPLPFRPRSLRSLALTSAPRTAGLQEAWVASSSPLPGCGWTGTGSFPAGSGSPASPPPHLTGAACPPARYGSDRSLISISIIKVSRAGGGAEEESELRAPRWEEGA